MLLAEFKPTPERHNDERHAERGSIMQQDAAAQDKKQQFDAAQNTEKLLTQERMKTLDLTVETARLKKEQAESAIRLQNEVQRSLN